MNSIQLVGRLTGNPETKDTTNSTVTRFSVAVRGDNSDDTDFFNCVAFGKMGEVIQTYFKKGHRIGLTGRMKIRKYEGKVYPSVYVSGFDFIEKKEETNEEKPGEQFIEQEDGLPFL